MKRGLVLIDMQNDYFEGGAMRIEGMEDVASKAKMLLEKFRLYQLDVFHTQQVNENSNHLISGTDGVMIYNPLKPKNAEKVVKKQFPNAFKNTELLTLIQKRSLDHLVFCGALVHSSVSATIRAARDFGFKCTVIDDVCACKDLSFRDEVVKANDVRSAFMAALSEYNVEILSLEEFLRL